MLYPILILPQGDTGRNGVFIYVGCADVVDSIRGYDAGFAYASHNGYSAVTPQVAQEQAMKRTAEQQDLIDRFLAKFHNWA